MLSSILKSETAEAVGIVIVRTFVQLRELLSTNKDLVAKLEKIEQKVGSHDQAIAGLIEAFRQNMSPKNQEKHRPIGFVIPIDPTGKNKK